MQISFPIYPGTIKLVYIELGRINTTESIIGFHSGSIGDKYDEKYVINFKDGR
jgi:hypothetical protein